MKRLLDYDRLTRTAVYHEYDEANKQTIIEEIQDVEPILETNKRIQTHDAGGAMGLTEYSRKGIKKGWWHVASIPNGVILRWKKEKGIDVFNKDHWKAVVKLLNDPEWRYLRTGTGRI